jgi:NADH-quinone oxidoreductase subunit C
MADALLILVEKLQTRFGDALRACALDRRRSHHRNPAVRAIEIFTALRDESEFAFEQVMDVCGVDYSTYGEVEWATGESTDKGFSRGVEERATGRGPARDPVCR